MSAKLNQPMILVIALVSTSFLAESSVFADDWPQWLGPSREPVWKETGILDAFPENGPPLRWKTPIGAGYSGPAVAKGRAFVMDRTMGSNLDDGKPLHEDPPKK